MVRSKRLDLIWTDQIRSVRRERESNRLEKKASTVAAIADGEEAR